MKIYKHWREYPTGKDEWPWPSFAPREMASRGEGELAIDEPSMDKLQALRNELNCPLMVNSAYRSHQHNKNVGGAKHSKHLEAKAYDISMVNHDPATFERAARKVGFTGFGYYKKNNFIHIDTGPPRSWNKRWYDPLEISDDLPNEAVYHPEKNTEDKSLMAAILAGGGSIMGLGSITDLGSVVGSLGNLSPSSQAIATGGIVISLFAVLYIVYERNQKHK